MAVKIANITELFHRFHNCEMQLRQGKIAACLISFREIIDRMPAIPKTEKEKSELHAGIEQFLQNLSAHKKFQDIFGTISFGDTDLETNLEFIKSMIVAQEEEIVERVRKDEETAEIQRLEIDREAQTRREALKKKIEQAIALIDESNLPPALQLISGDEEVLDAVVDHYNEAGMKSRQAGEMDTALEHFKKALTVSPDDEHLHYNLARAYFEAGDCDKAEEKLAKAVKINPDFEEGKAFYACVMQHNQSGASSGQCGGTSFKLIDTVMGKIQEIKDAITTKIRKAKIDHTDSSPPEDAPAKDE